MASFIAILLVVLTYVQNGFCKSRKHFNCISILNIIHCSAALLITLLESFQLIQSVMFTVSALSIEVRTTPTTAIVSFKHPQPKSIVRYEAYYRDNRGMNCAVAGNAPDLRCTIKHIPEATVFYVVARACFSGPNTCEDYIQSLCFTTLRRRHLNYFRIMLKYINCTNHSRLSSTS